MLISLFYISSKGLLEEILSKCLNMLYTFWSLCSVSCQLQVLSVGFSLPSSQRPASQKVGHLDTFQSSSGKGTHSLHIILLLLFPPDSLFSRPWLPFLLSVSLLFPVSKTKSLMVLRPEVDHFNSASQIFFKKTQDPETSEPVTVGWTRADQPGPGRL